VVDDVDELLGEEARVDGVAYGADAGDSVVQLEMPVSVPGKGRHAVAGLDAKCAQPMRQLGDPLVNVLVGGAVNAAFRRDRDDLGGGVHLCSQINDCRDRQLPIHHHSLQHRFFPPFIAYCQEFIGRVRLVQRLAGEASRLDREPRSSRAQRPSASRARPFR
jgi:hypothetical protein